MTVLAGWRPWPWLLGLGLLLVAWAYWPGLQGPWLLDDFVNLAPLEKISLQQDFYLDVIRGNLSGPLGRPISMSSFVLEKLYFDRGIEGQKLLGLLLHLANAWLVYLLAGHVFRAAGIKHAQGLGMLVALLWVSSPLLLSTTLYVVQRMTLLASLFSLLALIFYCRARESMELGASGLRWLLLAGLATLLAAFSKESGILALPLMTALELFIFGFRDRAGQVRPRLAWAHGLLIGIPLVALAGFLLARPDYLASTYLHREFSLPERLLTESRILWDYLAQLLWPELSRMGVYQDDYPLSKGLFEPPRTAVAVLAWLLVVLACGLSALLQRGRLLAFGVMFFLVGHTIESTFISLELYFEHRNYLPAVGLWFALVAAAAQLQQRWPVLRDWLAVALLCVFMRNTMMLGSQALIWSDSRLLHIDALNHHPDSARALLGLAQLYAADGNLVGALQLLQRLPDSASGGEFHVAIRRAIYHCGAQQVLAPELFAQVRASSTELSRGDVSDNLQQLVRLLIDERCVAVDLPALADQLRLILREDEKLRGSMKIVGAMLLLENHLQRYDRAREYAETILRREPDNIMALQFMLSIASVLDLPELRQQCLERLLALRDLGQLNTQQTYNLELFLEE